MSRSDHPHEEAAMVEAFEEDLATQYKNKLNFDIKEVSLIFGVKSPQTVRSWVEQGRFPHAFRTSSHTGGIRITRRDLVEFYKKYRIR